MEKLIVLTLDNITDEHICCAFSDIKCKDSYQLKKDWLKQEMANGYVFRRIAARAKVFIEYGPAENAWLPINAPNFLNVNCLWVSGRYKGNGYAKALLQSAIDDAQAQGKDGLVTVVGTKKFHFMSDTKWLLRQGFEAVQTLDNGFVLLAKRLSSGGVIPAFNRCCESGECDHQEGLVVYFSNRCPFSEYHVTTSLVETTKNRNLNVKVIKLDTMAKAQSCPSPATIFSLFYNGKFITTDISVCMDSRFDKLMKGVL